MSKSKGPANAFVGRAEPPDEVALLAALGVAVIAWSRFLARLASELDVKVLEWRCYSAKWGWSLRVKRKSRTIVWLGPVKGAFRVTFILGERAARAAREAGLSAALLKKVDNAEKYPEGRAVRFLVTSERSIPALMQLARLKISN